MKFPIHIYSGLPALPCPGINLSSATAWCGAIAVAWLLVGYTVWRRDAKWKVLLEFLAVGVWVGAAVGLYSVCSHNNSTGNFVAFQWNMWPLAAIIIFCVVYAIINRNNPTALYQLLQWPPSRAFPVIISAHWITDAVNGYVAIRTVPGGWSILGGDRFEDGLFYHQSVVLLLYAIFWAGLACIYIDMKRPQPSEIPLTKLGWRLRRTLQQVFRRRRSET